MHWMSACYAGWQDAGSHNQAHTDGDDSGVAELRAQAADLQGQGPAG